MKRKLLVVMVGIILVGLIGCGTDNAWRKTAVSTYEILGAGIGTTPSVADALKATNTINDEQYTRIKAVYAKARAIYVSMGNSLKLASAAVDAKQRDALLAEYDSLLAQFNSLANELYQLISSFKKTSLLEIKLWIEGGELNG